MQRCWSILIGVSLALGLSAAAAAHKHKHETPVAAAAAPLPTTAPAPAVLSRFVLLGDDGQMVARAVTTATTCPSMMVDNSALPMRVRAAAATLPLRPTRSDPEDSKPSAFPVLTCEAVLPATATMAQIDGQSLPLRKAVINRIVVIGDTGCRLKKSKDDGAYQECSDPAAYPFAKLSAAAAAWKPDLIVHVGDYHYRENACTPAHPGCANSPWGYGWDAWQADFFAPAASLLAVAPLAAVRGNHENCERGGQGWWRLLDWRPLEAGRDCNDPANDNIGDYSDAYAIPLGQNAQLIMLDLTKENRGAITAADQPTFDKFTDAYRKYAALAARVPYNIAANHIPILGFSAKAGKHDGDPVTLRPGDQGIQSAFSTINPWIIPDNVQLLLSGHIHVWEQVSFNSQHPSQFITGFSGTQEDIVPLPEKIEPNQSPAPGADVATFSSWVNGFGWMSLERTGPMSWAATVWDIDGKAVNHCTITGKASVCEVARVPAHG